MNTRSLFAKLSVSIAITVTFTALAAVSFAQGVRGFDRSQIPATATTVGGFVPKGWIIEHQIAGFLNDADPKPAVVMALIEDKPLTGTRSRALVVVRQDEKGTLTTAAVAGKLLHCTWTCGGSLWEDTILEPVSVKTENRVILIEQAGGAKFRYTEMYRFRFEASSGKFALIGYDYSVLNPDTGETTSESTNYVNGDRITKRSLAAGSTKSQATVTKIYFDDVDSTKFADEAGKRLGVR